MCIPKKGLYMPFCQFRDDLTDIAVSSDCQHKYHIRDDSTNQDSDSELGNAVPGNDILAKEIGKRAGN